MDTTDDREHRIRVRANAIWEHEGRPDGRADIHWDMATELVAIEDGQNDTLLPIGEAGEPVEPISALENVGEFPTTTDQGEMQNPHWPAPDDSDTGDADSTSSAAPAPKPRRAKTAGARKAGADA